MKLSEFKSLDQVVEEHREDPEFRAAWDRLAFARDVANRVVADRIEHGLSQRELAAIVGLVQPQIARLEKAEHQPSFDTLAKLTRATGLGFRFDVSNGGVELVSACARACCHTVPDPRRSASRAPSAGGSPRPARRSSR